MVLLQMSFTGKPFRSIWIRVELINGTKAILPAMGLAVGLRVPAGRGLFAPTA